MSQMGRSFHIISVCFADSSPCGKGITTICASLRSFKSCSPPPRRGSQDSRGGAAINLDLDLDLNLDLQGLWPWTSTLFTQLSTLSITMQALREGPRQRRRMDAAKRRVSSRHKAEGSRPHTIARPFSHLCGAAAEPQFSSLNSQFYLFPRGDSWIPKALFLIWTVLSLIRKVFSRRNGTG